MDTETNRAGTDLYLSALKRGGGVSRVARRLRVSRTTIYKWRDVGIPAFRLEEFCEVTGADVDALRIHARQYRSCPHCGRAA